MGKPGRKTGNIMSRDLSEAQNAFLGAGSGIIEVTINQPMAFFKNAAQQKLPLTLNPRVLYRGYAAACLNQGTVTCFQFVANGAIQQLVTGGDTRVLTASELLLSGALAGAASAFFCGPLELVMTQQQRKGTSLPATFAALGQRGPGNFFRGFGVTAARESVYTAGYLGLAPVVRSHLVEHFSAQEEVARAVGAFVAGISICAVTQPIDTCKTCLQGDVEQALYKGTTDTFRTLASENGLAAFYRGFGWRCARTTSAIFVLDKSRTFLSPILFPSAFPET